MDTESNVVHVSNYIDRRKRKKRHSPAVSDHLSKKQMVGWDPILVQIIERKGKWCARWDSNPQHPA